MSPPIPPLSPRHPYRTTDFYLACYLVFLKVPLKSVQTVGPNRVQFVFEHITDTVVLSYYNHEPLGSASFLDVVESIRHTRELLYAALDSKN